ncbi:MULTISPECIES: arsenite efflux MFS transporter ArsK [unclassified Mesorhizobium]|uniref:arsenite efflux MFS transporter ArsK n=1 Tax=unclassified Mesorhizobium TaxID=325217 RepID=UPI000FD3CC45|nr:MULTISPECIES: arsenite efflux MFS transporter ArsK [unclassified Mesorhizobium]RVB79560.1 MFS transporter [Mesorhizobium sp. M6A.T.Cr.TU.014.01.1.1]RWP78505.1 MAG: MFS transporter [Mesorhizobium sp.]RWQ00820.1 MAG: MFS transporter [Mesorhizobium sp.]RWQ00980.1 MAG: MFS transporter [Mesorhizobium sp.]
MSDRKIPAAALWALGLTQIIGYGTLYYSFSILVPSIALEFAWPEQWVFGALSASLLVGGLFAPTAGRWADRFGAGRVMTFGSAAAAAALVACALAPGRVTFVLALMAMELASAFVLYSAAFVAIVQVGGARAQRSITHLTLIAGFASTLFWPLTAALHEYLTWREVYLVFAGINVAICLPIHAWLARLSHRTDESASPIPAAIGPAGGAVASRDRSRVFLLMLGGFAVEGFVLSSILVHMVPLTTALGLGSAGLVVTTLFGPSQVASRLINMLFGGRLAQTWLAVIGATLLPLGLVALLATTPSVAGAIAFVILFGLGSGLASIVGGTLPLELFGRERYGARLGWVTAARQFSSALAPFALAMAMAGMGIQPSLWLTAAVGLLGILAFSAIILIRRQPLGAAIPLVNANSR